MLDELKLIGVQQTDVSFGAIYNHSLRAPSFRFHHHSDFEFYVFLHGSVKICIENMLFEAAPLDMFVFPPNYLHGLVSQDDHSDYERIYFHVKPEFLTLLSIPGYSLMATLDQIIGESRLRYTLDAFTVSELFRIITQIDELSRDGLSPLTSLKQHNLLCEAVLLMAEAIEHQRLLGLGLQYQKHPYLSVVLSYINDHFTEDLTLDLIAAHANVSKYHLSHEFQKFTNNTIMRYVINKRLQYAHKLLNTGAAPLDACLRSGFSSYSNFQKAFKGYFGVSPRQYKDLGDGWTYDAAAFPK